MSRGDGIISAEEAARRIAKLVAIITRIKLVRRRDRTIGQEAEYQTARRLLYYFRNHAALKAYRAEWARKRTSGKCGPTPKFKTNEEAKAAQNERVKRYYNSNLEKSRAKAAERGRKKRAALKTGTYNPKPKRSTTLLEKRVARKMHSTQRRVILKQRGAILVTPQVERQMRWRQNGLCPVCVRNLGEHDIHVDHWVPLAKGGAGDLENLRLLHGTCNLQKGTKHPDELKLGYEQRLAA